jgi:cell shape-determining protein MreD
MQLNVKGFALASGVLLGVAIFVITLAATGRGIGNNLSHLSAIYVGYQISYLGSVIGLIYGFLTGLVGGLIFAVIYNGAAKPKGSSV